MTRVFFRTSPAACVAALLAQLLIPAQALAHNPGGETDNNSEVMALAFGASGLVNGLLVLTPAIGLATADEDSLAWPITGVVGGGLGMLWNGAMANDLFTSGGDSSLNSWNVTHVALMACSAALETWAIIRLVNALQGERSDKVEAWGHAPFFQVRGDRFHLIPASGF